MAEATADARAGAGAAGRDSADVKVIGTMSEIARIGYLSTFAFALALPIKSLFSIFTSFSDHFDFGVTTFTTILRTVSIITVAQISIV